jgi:hypothetical protein
MANTRRTGSYSESTLASSRMVISSTHTAGPIRSPVEGTVPPPNHQCTKGMHLPAVFLSFLPPFFLSFLSLFKTSGGTGVWTQGFTLGARQALFSWPTLPPMPACLLLELLPGENPDAETVSISICGGKIEKSEFLIHKICFFPVTPSS